MAETAPAPKNILRGHKAQVHVAAFVRRNERLATGDAEGYVVLWDLAIMRPTAVWRAHEKAMLGIQGWGQDKVITHGRNHKLIVWKLAAEDEQGLSGVLPVEDVPTPRQQPWILHLLEVNTLNFCSFAACAREDGEGGCDLGASSDILVAVPNTLVSEAVDIYTLPGQARIHTINPGSKNGMAMSLRLLHLGGCLTLLAGFEDGCASVHRLDAAGGWIMTYRSQAHSQPILSLDVHPSREYFLTSSADSILAKHPIPTARQAVSVANTGGRTTEATGSGGSSGGSLLSDAPKTSADSRFPPSERLEEWKHPLKSVNTKHSGQQSLRIRSDGKIFATAGWDTNIRVYSCKTLKELAVLQWHKTGAYAVALADVGPGGSDQSSPEVAERAAQNASTALPSQTTTSLVGANAGSFGVKDRRIRQAKVAHWVAAGAKDGKVSLWDVY
ncbi:ASTRA-associated protein 1 [Tolypocladium paradoxum]|uniref:ASTRA-associated protein 1 n=1 Tax=Tolypocladium paradoxum TaxID=94208 RepID=A0A2S4KX28_9HYPO|nr:ASTRA-associated protein 1 [Tolypocladium paradoxum]